MGSRALLVLECSVCQGQYSSKQEWLGHLLEPRHQVPARQAIGSWERKSLRTRVLVVFSMQSVAEDDRLLRYFSRKLGTYVSDFVWWPERPKVAFIQFESSETVRKVLSPVKDQRVEVDGQMFHVKEAVSYSDFEWEGLLPAMSNGDGQILEGPSDSENDSSSESNVHMEEDSTSENCGVSKVKVDGNESLGKIGNVSAKANPVVPEKSAEATGGQVQVKVECQTSSRTDKPEPPSSSSGSGECSPLSLQHHLESIQKLVEIPEEEYNPVLRLRSQLQQVFSNARTQTRVILSRSWALKLKCGNPCRPLIFIQSKGSKKKLQNTACKAILKHLEDPEKTRGLFSSVRRVFPPPKHHEKEVLLSFSSTNLSLSDFPPVKLSGHKSIYVETQLWRLVKYLCTFDDKCEPLLALVYYWANLNSIKLEEPKKKVDTAKIPDPFGISWLVILFLCKEGHLPLPKLLLGRSGKGHCLQFGGTNIGFNEDPKFAQIWKANNGGNVSEKGSEAFALEVFTLAADFFLACGQTLGEGEWVIDSGSGEILRMENVRKVNWAKGTVMAPVKAMLGNGKVRSLSAQTSSHQPFLQRLQNYSVQLGGALSSHADDGEKTEGVSSNLQ